MIQHPDFYLSATAVRELKRVAPLIANKEAQTVVNRSIDTLRNAAKVQVSLFEPRSASHDTVSLYNELLGESVDIDTELVPLIKSLWSIGCNTQFSCQGERDARFVNQAYISFANGAAADLFLRALDLGGCREVALLTTLKHDELTFDDCDILFNYSFGMNCEVNVYGRPPRQLTGHNFLPPLRVSAYFSNGLIPSMTKAVERYILEHCSDKKQRQKRRRIRK